MGGRSKLCIVCTLHMQVQRDRKRQRFTQLTQTPVLDYKPSPPVRVGRGLRMTRMSRFSPFTWAISGMMLLLIGQEVTAFTPQVLTRAPSTLSSRSRLSCPPSSLALPSRAARMSPLSSTQQGDGNIVVGEDSGAFSLKEQSVKSWAVFGVLVSIVLGALFVLWINPSTGFGDEFIAAIESFSPNSSVTIALLLTIFGVAHSGLASLRAPMEEVIGARAWRVIFALTSLPLASSAIGYFINHRYDGVQLWDYRLVPGVHDLVWVLSFVSFYFLYPSTFNLLEIAAVEKPKLHMWATGIMRITRHPQMVGQGLWCFAHSLWMGNSFVLVTSVFLMLHHILGVWNGDRRLSERYGETFEEYKGITSVMPLQAIVEGRQQLPSDYWKEFLRLPYLIIAAGTLGAYYAHPFMQAGAWTLHW